MGRQDPVGAEHAVRIDLADKRLVVVLVPLIVAFLHRGEGAVVARGAPLRIVRPIVIQLARPAPGGVIAPVEGLVEGKAEVDEGVDLPLTVAELAAGGVPAHAYAHFLEAVVLAVDGDREVALSVRILLDGIAAHKCLVDLGKLIAADIHFDRNARRLLPERVVERLLLIGIVFVEGGILRGDLVAEFIIGIVARRHGIAANVALAVAVRIRMRAFFEPFLAPRAVLPMPVCVALIALRRRVRVRSFHRIFAEIALAVAVRVRVRPPFKLRPALRAALPMPVRVALVALMRRVRVRSIHRITADIALAVVVRVRVRPLFDHFPAFVAEFPMFGRSRRISGSGRLVLMRIARRKPHRRGKRHRKHDTNCFLHFFTPIIIYAHASLASASSFCMSPSHAESAASAAASPSAFSE